MNAVIIIPARLASTRLPEKLLLHRTGKPLIQHTYEAASRSRLANQVVVATDSPEIDAVVSGFGGTSILTSVEHSCGTERVAEAVAEIAADLVVNVQGDEPEIEGEFIDRLIRGLHGHAQAAVATLATPIRSCRQLYDPACVKVVFDREGLALYFSRSPIPTPRSEQFVEEYFSQEIGLDNCSFYQHVGVYAYRREALHQITRSPKSTAEEIESLEQLRFLDRGWRVWVDRVDHGVAGIDTIEDYDKFVNRQRKG